MIDVKCETTLMGIELTNGDKINASGYPLYPVDENIYNYYNQEQKSTVLKASVTKTINN